jgi:hypothetical protein
MAEQMGIFVERMATREAKNERSAHDLDQAEEIGQGVARFWRTAP